MPYNNKVLTSIHGRRLGLQRLSSAESGGSGGTKEYLVGPEDLRMGVSTAETTATRISAFGVSRVTGASSGVYTLDPPVPGVEKTIVLDSNNVGFYLKTANSETIVSTQNTSGTTLKSTASGTGVISLLGVSTAVWAAVNISGFTATTST